MPTVKIAGIGRIAELGICVGDMPHYIQSSAFIPYLPIRGIGKPIFIQTILTPISSLNNLPDPGKTPALVL